MKQVLFLLLLVSNLAQGQVPLLKNGNLSGGLLNGKPLFTDYPTLYFWTTDGTPAGTKKMTTKVQASDYGGGTLNSDKFYFTGSTADSGQELWCTDGTDAGTFMVKEIRPGTSGALLTSFFNYGNKVLFFADNGTHGLELWITDGTSVGTTLVKDIRPGAEGSIQPGDWISYIEVAGQVYFMANDGVNGWALWKTNGTAVGTQLVKDINSDPDDALYNVIDQFHKIGNTIYFVGEDPTYGMELWRSDGTAAGTYIVKDIVPDNSGGVDDDGVIVFNNKLLFSVFRDNGNDELWTSDGTSAGTIKVKSFVDEDTDLEMEGGVIFPNGLLFVQYCEQGAKLWRTDGTTAGTVQINAPGNVYDIWIRNSYTEDYQHNNLPTFNGKVFFTTEDEDNSNGKLWLTDGTEAGTAIVTNVSGVGSYLYGTGKFYFFGYHPTSADSISIYQTNGTAAGTAVIQSFSHGGNYYYTYPQVHFEYNGHVYYSADDLQDNERRTDLYRSGTPSALPTYTFTGNGSWENPANWLNNQMPPSNLTSGEIIINHAAGGECVMTPKTLSTGVKLTVLSGKTLRITN